MKRSLPSWVYSRKITLAVLGSIFLLSAVVVGMAPTERMLGDGIRVVYVHVALIWTGMLGLLLAGLLGLVLLLIPRRALARWLGALGKVAFGFYLASSLVSLVAQQVNWGGISWNEPRTEAMLQILAAALIVQILSGWVWDARIQGGLHALLGLFLLWSWQTTPLQLHPDNPVGTSTSATIPLVFYGLFALSALAATWLTLHLRALEQARSGALELSG